MRPTGPFQISSPSSVASLPGPVVNPSALDQSECVTPVCSGLSSADSIAGITAWRAHALCEVTNIRPECGSAAWLPVMLVPPPSPGQSHAGPAGSSIVFGGLNIGTKRLFSRAISSARS